MRHVFFKNAMTYAAYLCNFMQGETAALAWSKLKIFNFLLRYMCLFCNENAGIMKSCKPGNLQFCGESAAYLKKCGPRMNMRTLADMRWIMRSHNHVFLEGLHDGQQLADSPVKCWCRCFVSVAETVHQDLYQTPAPGTAMPSNRFTWKFRTMALWKRFIKQAMFHFD